MVCQAAVTMEAMGEDQPPIIIATQVVDLALAPVVVAKMLSVTVAEVAEAADGTEEVAALAVVTEAEAAGAPGM